MKTYKRHPYTGYANKNQWIDWQAAEDFIHWLCHKTFGILYLFFISFIF
jgi:hypothetical protein